MAAMKWVKLNTDLFDDKRIRRLKKTERWTDFITLWINLLCIAGQDNNGGVFMFNENTPYTVESFSDVTDIDRAIVEEGISKFIELGMMENDGGVYVIPDWGITQSEDSYNKKRERDKEYRRQKREEQRKIVEEHKSKAKQEENQSSNDEVVEVSSTTRQRQVDDTSTASERVAGVSDISSLSVSTSNSNSKSKSNIDYIYIQNLFNEKCRGIMPKITSLSDKRKRRMKACQKYLEQFGGWEALVEKIVNSDFLSGRTGTDWQLTIDWILNIDNTTKIMEGNYDNSKRKKPSQTDPDHDKWMGPDYTGPDLPF